MIKSISYWSLGGTGGPVTLDEALQQARDHGFPGLELCIAEQGPFHVNLSESECKAMRQKIDAAGITVQTLASGMSWGANPASDDAAVRKHAIEIHAKALQVASWLGCASMLFVPGAVGGPISAPPVRYDRVVDRAREAVGQLLDVAAKVNVDLCVENVWNGLFYSPLEFNAFIDSFNHPNLGVYFDVGNVLGYHQHPPHWIELLGKRIRRVHIKDFKCSLGSLAGFCDLMAGDVPWEASIKALRAIGYDKTIVAEMMPWDAGLLDRTSAALDRILKM